VKAAQIIVDVLSSPPEGESSPVDYALSALSHLASGLKHSSDYLGVAHGKEDSDIPVRLALGRDCWDAITGKTEDVQKDLREWKDVSQSTDF